MRVEMIAKSETTGEGFVANVAFVLVYLLGSHLKGGAEIEEEW